MRYKWENPKYNTLQSYYNSIIVDLFLHHEINQVLSEISINMFVKHL